MIEWPNRFSTDRESASRRCPGSKPMTITPAILSIKEMLAVNAIMVFVSNMAKELKRI
jgi:hypothetical protein